MALTKNSKNKEIAEEARELCETFKPFIYFKSDAVKSSKDGRHYYQAYIALAVPEEGTSKLEQELMGWSGFRIKRGIMNVCVEAVKGTKLGEMFGTLLTPMEGVKMIITQTIEKPYDAATPKLKPGKDGDEDYILCDLEGRPVYEVTTFDYGVGIELNSFEDTDWYAKSMFTSEFKVMA